MARKHGDKGLTPLQEEIILIFDDEGVTQRQIGAFCGVHYSTVSRFLDRAKTERREPLFSSVEDAIRAEARSYAHQ